MPHLSKHSLRGLSRNAFTRLSILIGGGSGFLGQALASSLRSHGHEVKIISRTRDLSFSHSLITWDDIKRDGLPHSTDAVINLAGSNIMDFKKLWTCSYMEECVTSRVSTTEIIAKAIAKSISPPSVWISTSAVGFYPPSKDNEYDEKSVVDVNKADKDWMSQLCSKIENAAKIPGSQTRTRSVIMRTGIVLGKGGGAYSNMQLPFYCCLGGTFGDGSQWFPYVHLNDVVRAYEFVMSEPRARGPINVVAPSACTNFEFTKALGEAMWRPTILPVPSFMSSFMGTERGSILFDGQHVKPNALTSMGFKFHYPDVTSCCQDLALGDCCSLLPDTSVLSPDSSQ